VRRALAVELTASGAALRVAPLQVETIGEIFGGFALAVLAQAAGIP
jgi:hypothetical protein